VEKINLDGVMEIGEKSELVLNAKMFELLLE